MKFFLITILTVIEFGINSNFNADYTAPSYYSMLANSDLIILSEIIGQTDSTVTLKIKKTLKGKIDISTLKLKKFKDWSCASRHYPYSIGQKQLNILKKLEDGSYGRMSAGNECELPIDSGYIYFKSWLNGRSQYESNYGRMSGFRFDYDETINGLHRMIKITEKISSNEKNCKLLQIVPKTPIESMVIEEQIMRMNLICHCDGFEKYSFKVISNTR